MNTVILESVFSYTDSEVELAPGIFGVVNYQFSFQVSGEDPHESFDVDVLVLTGVNIQKVLGPETQELPVLPEYQAGARSHFWAQTRDFVEDFLFRKIAFEGLSSVSS